MHVLSAGQYLEAATSSVLPGIDLGELCGYLERASTGQASREYRAALNQGSSK